MVVSEEIENKEIAKQYKELLSVSYQTLSKNDKKQIRTAFDIAVDAHRNQRRKTGEAYIFHPLAVARIVANEIGLDSISIAAALLHDVVEDTKYTIEEIKSQLGHSVAKIVDGLTKISNLKKDTDISLQAENFRKMLLTLNDDLRVIIIKIADRLHNMQTLEAMPEEKQLKTSSETRYIYAPLAHRIGLYNVKTELEDLSLKYTDPEKYFHVKSKIEEGEKSQISYIKSFSNFVSSTLQKEGLKYYLKGRSKSIYSIYSKMEAQNIPFEKVYDKFAIRVVYKSNERNEKFLAWKIYSVITDHFTPNPTRLRDWITAPKSNGYEALHITVNGPDNKWVEIQIRSERMHEIAEKGYAAHYKYKDGDHKDLGIENWIDKLKEVLEDNTGNAIDFVEDFKLNLYAEEIFVFTPTGELKSLPKFSTALDFAFNIHTEVGMKTRGARVNDILVPLSKVLKSGDQIEIITSENIKPTANWLDFVQTSRARSKIKSSLNEEKKLIAKDGKELLRRKLKQLKIVLNEKTSDRMYKYFKLDNSLDLFYRIGIGTIENKDLKSFASYFNNSFFNFFRRKNINPVSSDTKKDQKNELDKVVFGKERQSLSYTLSSCCNPISGDPVFGFLTINDGLKVHKKDCPNALTLQSNFGYRIILAKWVISKFDKFTAVLKLSGIDDLGLLNEVTRLISNDMNVNINKINLETENGFFSGFISVSVQNKKILDRLTKNLTKLKGIEKVKRE
ncbi:MAG: RelA/SpoT family protein [Flavobacteriaceae bacterium]|nr:RelA/SpoT family protein [Flavobacteriaceae bacterium]